MKEAIFSIKDRRKLKILILGFLIFSNFLSAQIPKNFLNDFLLEDELESKNVLLEYSQSDFSNIWNKTQDQFIYGIIGEEHQRIRIKLISINKNNNKPNEYYVVGKSLVKKNICDFSGTITIKEIREVKSLHFGVDNKMKDKGIKKQGILIADYNFKENTQQQHSGIFIGKVYSKWYMNNKNEIIYDDIQSISDSYFNNAFIGTWKSYLTGKEKKCNWADWRVPNANQDFDIGAGEFSVSEKYWNKGWSDFGVKGQNPNIAKENRNKIKKWWE